MTETVNTERMTTVEATQILSDHDGVDYSYGRGINGMVLSWLRPDGYGVEQPCDSLPRAVYERTGRIIENS